MYIPLIAKRIKETHTLSQINIQEQQQWQYLRNKCHSHPQIDSPQ